MNFAPGNIVAARGREWIVLPESSEDLLMVRPLGGTDVEVTGICRELEEITGAALDLPDANHVGDHRSCQLLRDAVRLGFRSSGIDNSVDYTGSGTDVTVFQGTNNLTATTVTDANSLQNNQFFVTTSIIQSETTNITIGTSTVTTDDEGNSVLRFADHSSLDDSFVQIKYAVTLKTNEGVVKTIPRIQTLTKSNAGLNAKVAKLLANQYVVQYSESGTEGDTIELEVQYQGFDTTPYIYFYINDSQTAVVRDDDTVNTYTLEESDEPVSGGVTNIRVELQETTDGEVLASDSISIYGVQNGSDAITAFLTNPSHVVPTDSDGNVDTNFVTLGEIQGAGGTYKVFVGANDVTTQCTFTISPNDTYDTISSIDPNTGVYTILEENINSGGDYNIEIYQVTIPADIAQTTEDVVLEANYSIAKSKAGVDALDISFDLTNENVTLPAQEDGTLKGSSPYATTVPNIYDRGSLVSGFISYGNSIGNNVWTITSSATGLTGSFNGTTYRVESVSSDSASVTFTASKAGSANYVKTFTVSKARDAARSLTGYLTNEVHTVAAFSDGTLVDNDFSNAGGQFVVFLGDTDVSDQCTFSIQTSLSKPEAPDWIEFDTTSDNYYSITNVPNDRNTAVLKATYGDTSIQKFYTINKTKGGFDAKILRLEATGQSFVEDKDGTLTGDDIVFTVHAENIDLNTLDVEWETYVDGNSSPSDPDVLDIQSDGGATLSKETFNTSNIIRVRASVGEYSDTISVYRIKDGIPATIYSIVPSVNLVRKSEEGTLTPTTLNFERRKTVGSETTTTTDGTVAITSDRGDGQGFIFRQTSPPYTINSNDLSVKATYTVNSVVVDTETVPIVEDGPTGSAGTDSKTVKLTSSRYAIEYDANGNVVDNSTITLTASSLNFENGFFKFTGAGSDFTDETTFTDGTGQNSDTATFTPPSTFFATPLEFRVGVSEGDQNEVAFDTIDIFAVKPGADGDNGLDGYTVVMTNESHTFTADNDGVVSNYDESGTTFKVYKGSTPLIPIESGTPTTGQFTVTVTNDYGITKGTTFVNQSTYPYQFFFRDDISNFENNLDTAYIDYEVNVENIITFQRQQSFSKSKQGNSGTSIKLAYIRSATEPSLPTGGTLSSPPTGWSYTVSGTTGADILWQSAGTFDSNGDNVSWEEVQQFIGLDGAAGKNSWAIFEESSSQPSTPSTGDEDTAPSGWSFQPPSNPTNPLWVSYGKYVNDAVTYTTPSKYYSRLTVSDLLAGTLSVQMDISAGGNIVNDTTVSSGNYSTTTSAGYYLSDDGDFFVGAANSDTSNGTGTYIFFDSSQPEFTLNGENVVLNIGEGNSTTNSTIQIDKEGIFVRSDYITSTTTPKSRIKIENSSANPFINLADNVNDKSSVISTVAIRLNDDSTNGGKFSVRASSSNTTGGSNISNALGTSDPALFTGSLIRSKRGTTYSYSGLTYSDNYTFFHSNGVWLGTRDSNVSTPNPSPTHFIDLNGNDGSSPYLEIVDVGNLSTTSDNKIKIGATSSGGYTMFL